MQLRNYQESDFLKKSIIALVIILMTMLVSCGKNSHGDYSKIYERYSHIESYSAQIKVTAFTDGEKTVYTANQSYLAPKMYRLDYTSDIMKGISCVLNGGRLYYRDAEENMTEFKGYIPHEKYYIFINDFFERYCKTEDAKSQQKGNYTVLTLKENNDNPHRAYMQVFIDKNSIPKKLLTYNEKGEIAIEVEFLKFNMDEKLSKKDFEL